MIKRILLFAILYFTLINYTVCQQLRTLSKQESDQIGRFKEMADIFLNDKDALNAAKTYSQIAFVYWKAGIPREAIDNFISSSDLFLQKSKLDEVKNIYSNIGVIYTDLEELEFALDYFEKSLTIRRKIGKQVDIASGLIDVAYILQNSKFYDDAIKRLEEALAIATEEKNSHLILDCYQLLSQNYDQTGNLKKSKEYASKAESYQAFLDEESMKQDYTDKVLQTESKVAKTEAEKQLAATQFELRQVKYRMAEDSLNSALKTKQDSLYEAARIAKQRQLEIENLNKEKQLQTLAIEKQQAKQRNQQLVIAMIAGGFALMVLLAIIMFRANRNRRKANTKLARQNKEIAEKSEQLGQALKKIAHQNQNITQSINYAKGIQQALLPKADQLNDYLPDSFILFKPRDIVSGDFYWFRQIDAKSDIFKIFGMHRREEENKANTAHKKLMISAVDCTGHGVPGAFMSMIGFNLLDEITNKGITRPDLILEEMHRGVRFTLKQKETNNQDGMDMSLCVIDQKDRTIEFAGAKNPLIYVQNNEVFQIKGDKNGIGGKSDDHNFTLTKLTIDQPTWFYIFSDGYIDQFGGDVGRKFMIKEFRDLLLQIHQLPMSEQRNILNKVIKEWMGTKYNQIDDVLVIGFKLDFENN